MSAIDDNKLDLHRKRYLDALADRDLLKMMYESHCYEKGPLDPGYQEAYNRLLSGAEERMKVAELHIDAIRYRLVWLWWRDIEFKKHDGSEWCIRAGYSKNRDKEGYYHWSAEIFRVTDIGGFRVGHSQQLGGEKFAGKFKKRNSARDAANRKLEALKVKHLPKKRQPRKAAASAAK